MENEELSIFPERTIVYATFWQRFAAALIDGVLLSICFIIVHRVIGGGHFLQELWYGVYRQSSITGELATTVISWLYYSLLESGAQQATVGKMAMGLKVTDTGGYRVSFGRATGRHFAKNISFIILMMGYFMMLWDERNQTLHDKMAGTLAVKQLKAI